MIHRMNAEGFDANTYIGGTPLFTCIESDHRHVSSRRTLLMYGIESINQIIKRLDMISSRIEEKMYIDGNDDYIYEMDQSENLHTMFIRMMELTERSKINHIIEYVYHHGLSHTQLMMAQAHPEMFKDVLGGFVFGEVKTYLMVTA